MGGQRFGCSALPFACHQIGKVVTFGFLAAMALAQAITT
jgi:hypothetical protein